MNATRHTPGIRIGILHGGQLVEERVLLRRRDIRVGPTARDTFIVPASAAVPRSLLLFTGDRDGYTLCLGAAAEGAAAGRAATERAATGAAATAGAVREVPEVRVVVASGHAPLSASALRGEFPSGRVPLGAGARGRITLGEMTVLFQVVAVPAERAQPRLPPSLRGSLLGSLDWVLLALVGISLIGHTAFVLYLRGVDLPRPDVADLPERVATAWRLLPRPAVLVAPSPPAVAPPVVAHPVGGRGHAPADPIAGARRRAQHLDAARLAALRLVGARGRGGAIADLLRRGGADGDAEQVFREVEGATIATREPGLTLRGLADPPRRRDVDLARLRVGPVDSGERALEQEAHLRGDVRAARPLDVDPDRATCKTEQMSREVRAHLGGVVACYERVLHRNESLSGKVQVRFTVSGEGRVTAADIEEDTLRDPQVLACLTSQIRHWIFPGLDCGQVQFSYPFVFVPTR